MPNSYDCSRNAMSDRVAEQRAQRAEWDDIRALARRITTLENRVAQLETRLDLRDPGRGAM